MYPWANQFPQSMFLITKKLSAQEAFRPSGPARKLFRNLFFLVKKVRSNPHLLFGKTKHCNKIRMPLKTFLNQHRRTGRPVHTKLESNTPSYHTMPPTSRVGTPISRIPHAPSNTPRTFGSDITNGGKTVAPPSPSAIVMQKAYTSSPTMVQQLETGSYSLDAIR